MEKLIELVYYYNSHLDKGHIWIWLTTSIKENGREVPFDKEKEIRKYENYIISKKYWFIERLVKNDKVKYEYISWWVILANNTQYITYTESEDLIMQLSIQENPIEYLCSILK